MNVSTSRLKIVSTPGFARESVAHNLDPLWTLKQAGRLLKSEEPSWVVGDPESEAEGFDDEGRTLKVPAPFRFWVIRDDHPEACTLRLWGQPDHARPDRHVPATRGVLAMPTLTDFLDSVVSMLDEAVTVLAAADEATSNPKLKAWIRHRAALLDDQAAGITRDIEDLQSLLEASGLPLEEPS